MGKQKKNNAKRKALNEFRYNYATGHTNYVFEDTGNRYNGVGLTTDPTTFKKSNMPLKTNAKKNDTVQSYVRNGIVSKKKNKYSSVDKRFKFSDDDFKNVKSKIRNFKNNRRKKGK